MPNKDNLEEIKIHTEDHTDLKIMVNKELSMGEAMIPVIALVIMLAYNVFVYGDDALSGSNQFILLLGGAVAAIVGFKNKVSYKTMIDDKFDFGFAVDWMRKDLKIAIDEAKKNNSPLPVTKIVDGYYEEIQKMGGNRWDTSSLIRRLRKK